MHKYERKYIRKEWVFILVLLIASLSGNVWQNMKINELVEMDQADIESYELLSNQYETLENRYEILWDEYNDLYESTK